MFELFNMYQEAVYSICRAIIIRVIQDQVVELLVDLIRYQLNDIDTS